jgi:hypothetical protein
MPGNRWENNIGIDLKEIGINAMNFFDSAQELDTLRAFVDALLNLRL